MSQLLYNSAQRLLLVAYVAAVVCFGPTAYAAGSRSTSGTSVLGNRLLTSVNHVPYSQRQLELYFVIRENLRQEAPGPGDVVSASNWQEALTMFNEDMVILQEAQRLGSFAAADAALDKYTELLRTRRLGRSPLTKTMERLDCDELTLARTLDSVLRVIAFRRSKDRQEAQEATAQRSKKAAAQPKWLTELIDRSTLRLYDGAKVFVRITPVVGQRDDGP